jgi:predicted transcriptional regulator
VSGSTIERLELIEQVGDLHLKSYKPSEIARNLGISPAQAKHYIAQYQELLRRRVNEDPDFLDRVADNTFEALERLDGLVKEAWETYETAKNNDLINQQINLLKVAGAFEQQRANLLQLMGAKMDSGMTARMQRAEQVNSIVARIIKEVVSDCDHCKVEVMPRLAEAFAKMNQETEAVDLSRIEDSDVIDAEVIEEEEVEEDEHDMKGMMGDIVAYD